MKIHTSPSELAAEHPHIVFAAGFFDGAHLGHRAIFDGVRQFADAAERSGLARPRTCVLTFNRHPLEILAPERKPALLTTFRERLRLIGEAGIESCLTLDFTRELSSLTPAEFVAQIFGDWLAPGKSVALAAGENWRFGSGGAGNLDAAAAAGGGKLQTLRIPSVTVGGELVSSSTIRRLIGAGELALAGRMLGRAYEIGGVTVRGRGVGSKIGFATANIKPDSEVLPPCGVYAAEVKLPPSGQWLPAVANLGFCPTFGDDVSRGAGAPTLEAHILNGAEGELYGCEIITRLASKLRDEQKFPSVEKLVEQIGKDIRNTLEIARLKSRET